MEDFWRVLVVYGEFFEVGLESIQHFGFFDDLVYKLGGFLEIFLDPANFVVTDDFEIAVFLAVDMRGGQKRSMSGNCFEQIIGASFANNQI